jgi:hypothetical protein
VGNKNELRGGQLETPTNTSGSLNNRGRGLMRHIRDENIIMVGGSGAVCSVMVKQMIGWAKLPHSLSLR